MSRKQYKIKRHSCGLCKPQKVGWENRWKERQRILDKIHQREMASA